MNKKIGYIKEYNFINRKGELVDDGTQKHYEFQLDKGINIRPGDYVTFSDVDGNATQIEPYVTYEKLRGAAHKQGLSLTTYKDQMTGVSYYLLDDGYTGLQNDEHSDMFDCARFLGIIE